MTTMMIELYDALKETGVSEAKVRDAARATSQS